MHGQRVVAMQESSLINDCRHEKKSVVQQKTTLRIEWKPKPRSVASSAKKSTSRERCDRLFEAYRGDTVVENWFHLCGKIVEKMLH
jgi:hypothetical protein